MVFWHRDHDGTCVTNVDALSASNLYKGKTASPPPEASRNITCSVPFACEDYIVPTALARSTEHRMTAHLIRQPGDGTAKPLMPRLFFIRSDSIALIQVVRV